MVRVLLLVVLLGVSSGLYANALKDAQGLFEAGKYNQAMTRVEAYLKSQPKSAEARFLKGLILVEQGQSAAAIDVFTGLTRDYPELPEPYNNIAVIYAAEGDYDGARSALQAALKTHPSYATAYENLGDIYAKLASEAYQQALDLEKRDQGQGKLKVKLSLIDNLFMEEPQIPAQVVAASRPANPAPPAGPRPQAKVDSKPVKVAVTQPAPVPVKADVAQPAAKPVKVVATRPAAKPVKRTSSAEQSTQISRTMSAWAKAWSAQNVDGYLAFYAPSFKPAKGSPTKWRAQRYSRLTRPSFIRVGLANIKMVALDEKSATIELTQAYESNTYKDTTRKRFDLIMVDGQWKINREVSL